MQKMRNLVIGCDGTWNDSDTDKPTNVVKILSACVNRRLEKHYMEGVGTAHLEALRGGIYGANIERQILSSYNFLWKRFRQKDWPREQNRIFMFGFSRGAYAARRLAGLVSFAGIPVKDADRKLGWQLFLNQDIKSMDQLKKEGRFFDHPIEALAVWDTVKTTGDSDLHDNRLPKAVVAGYHAMAIDENRKFFPVLKWNSNPRARQVWFAGVHADVGGGYKQVGLSDIALRWMEESMVKHGLEIKVAAFRKLKPEPNGKLHDSFEGVWKTLGKKIRSITKTALVHESVQERMDNGYAPTNMPENPTFVKR
jgi:uncharacterized protein (DUF2235 family)